MTVRYKSVAPEHRAAVRAGLKKGFLSYLVYILQAFTLTYFLNALGLGINVFLVWGIILGFSALLLIGHFVARVFGEPGLLHIELIGSTGPVYHVHTPFDCYGGTDPDDDDDSDDDSTRYNDT
jgi:hypothetical protein